MRKKRSVSIVIAALLVMAMLAGCGGSAGKGNESSSAGKASESSASAESAAAESTAAESAVAESAAAESAVAESTAAESTAAESTAAESAAESTAAESASADKAEESSAATGEVIKIGYVNPTTGPLAGNGEGCDWVVKQIESYVNDTLGGIEVDGAKSNIKVIVYDSASDQATCAEMADKLCVEDEVDLIIAIQTPETVIPVEAKAEQYEVPCIGIQAPVNPCAFASDDHLWTVHAFWTIEKVYEQHKALWEAAGYAPNTGAKVGIAFANDSDGSAWYQIFTENLEKDGYVLVDPGQYPSGTDDFSNIVKKYKDEDIDILAGTNIPPDFNNLYTQMIAADVEVGCITMGKCCLLPGDVAALGDMVEGIMSEVWWAPNYPYASGLTGISCADLGAAYLEDNGGVMPQPAGYAYAALELAVQAFTNAGTTDKEAVMEALRALDVETIVGPIKYDKEMNGLAYGDTVIAGGQWQKGEDGTWNLVVIDATTYPELEVAITGEYIEGNATIK